MLNCKAINCTYVTVIKLNLFCQELNSNVQNEINGKEKILGTRLKNCSLYVNNRVNASKAGRFLKWSILELMVPCIFIRIKCLNLSKFKKIRWSIFQSNILEPFFSKIGKKTQG